MIHERKFQTLHEDFFTFLLRHIPFSKESVINIVTDREKGIVNAIKNVLPNAKILFCWNHIKRDFKFWLRTRGAAHDEIGVYCTDLDNLLHADSQEDFEMFYQELSGKWSEAAVSYFESYLKADIENHTGKWVIEQYVTYNPVSGITNNASEAMNTVLHRLVQWKEVPVDTMVLCLYHLQNFYLNETLRGLCDLGNYKLIGRFRCLKQEADDLIFPTKLCDPTSIVDHVRTTSNDFYSYSSEQSNDEKGSDYTAIPNAGPKTEFHSESPEKTEPRKISVNDTSGYTPAAMAQFIIDNKLIGNNVRLKLILVHLIDSQMLNVWYHFNQYVMDYKICKF